MTLKPLTMLRDSCKTPQTKQGLHIQNKKNIFEYIFTDTIDLAVHKFPTLEHLPVKFRQRLYWLSEKLYIVIFSSMLLRK